MAGRRKTKAAGDEAIQEMDRAIADLRKAEEEVKKREERYRKTLDNMLEGCQIIGFDWRYLYVNDAVAKHGSANKKALLGRTMMEVYPGIEKTKMFANLRRCMKKRISIRMENEFKFPDGSKGWFDLGMQPVPEGIFILSQDITERKKAEEALRASNEELTATNEELRATNEEMEATNEELKATTEELKQSEERYKQLSHKNELILGSSGEGIFGLDLKGNITFINPAAAKMLGWKREELIGKPAHGLTHHTKPNGTPYPRGKCPIHAAYKDALVHRVDNEVFWRKDGASLPVEYVSTPIMEKGKLAGAVVTFSDITARKRMEEELRFRAEAKRLTYEFSPAAIILLDAKANVTDASRKLYDSLGYKPEEIFGKSLFKMPFLPEDTKRIIAEKFSRRMRGKEIPAYDAVFVSKQGKTVVGRIRGSALRDEQGRITGALLLVADVTEQKKIEDALRENEQRLTTLYANVADIIVSLRIEPGGKFRFESANPAFFKGTGLNAGQVVGKLVSEVIPSPSLELFLSKCHEAIQSRKTVHWEATTQYPTGRKVGDVVVTPIFDKHGTCTQLIGTVHDITTRKKAEDALRASEELYHSLFENMLNGFAYCKMIYKNGKPHDFTYLDVNKSFEKLTGLKNVVGKKVSEVIPGIQQSDKKLFELYGRVASTGRPEAFETYLAALKMWFLVSVYSPQKGYFVAVFDVITKRKKAEAALHESEEKYRALTESTNDTVYSADANGKITFISQQIKRYGLKPEDLISKNFVSLGFIPLEDRMRMASDFRKSIATGESFATRFRIRDKKGGVHWIEENSSLHYDARGKVAGLAGVLRDVTERVTAEEALKESEEKYRTIIESTTDSIILLDMKGFIKFVNPMVLSITQQPLKYFVGKHFARIGIIPLSQRVRLGKIFAMTAIRRLVTGKPRASPYSYAAFDVTAKSGELVPVEMKASNIVSEGKATGIVVSLRDLRERKKAEAEREVERETARGIVEGEGIPIFVLNKNHQVMYWNKACEEMTRWKAGGVVGTDLHWKAFYKEKRRMLADYVLDSAMPGKKDYEVVMASKLVPGALEGESWFELRGERVYLSMTAAPIKDAKGKLLGAVETFLDITGKKKAEEMLKNHGTELEKEVEARTADLREEIRKVETLSDVKDEFIRNISHELKSPLSVILLNIPLAKKMAETGNKNVFDELMEMTDRSATRLRNSIENILELSRIGTVMEYKRERVEARKIVDYAVDIYGPIAEKKGLELETSVEPVAVTGDPALLPYALTNLVGNAVKFTEKGKVRITVKSTDSQVEIAVSDTGPGISEENQKRLFEKFFKADPNAPGTGIGLAIVKEVVERHKGRVEVKSALGKGSTFTVILPKQG